MLAFNKKLHYALIAINYLAQRPERIASAREIADAHNLPLALLMNILKDMHHKKVLRSLRGTRGGYSLDIDLRQYTPVLEAASISMTSMSSPRAMA